MNWKCYEKRGRKGKRRGWDNENKRKIENNIAITFECINDYKKRNITTFCIISYEYRSAENLIDGGDGIAIPPVVARIFSGNRTSPLAREARALAIFEG